MDILGLFKAFCEKPDKNFNRAVVVFKVCMNLILANYFYIIQFGSYSLIDLSSPPQWWEFIRSGQILLCLICLGASYLLLHIACAVLFWPIKWIFDRRIKRWQITSEDSKNFRAILRVLGVLEYEHSAKKWMAGHNIDKFVQVIKEFSCDREPSPVARFKHALLHDVWYICIGLFIVEGLVLSVEVGIIFNAVLLFVALLVPIYYSMLSRLFLISKRHNAGLLRDIKKFKAMRIICDGLRSAGSPIVNVYNPANKGNDEYVNIAGTKFLLRIHLSGTSVENAINIYRAEGERENTNILVLTDQHLTKPISIAVADAPEKLFVISVTDKARFISKVREISTAIMKARRENKRIESIGSPAGVL